MAADAEDQTDPHPHRPELPSEDETGSESPLALSLVFALLFKDVVDEDADEESNDPPPSRTRSVLFRMVGVPERELWAAVARVGSVLF